MNYHKVEYWLYRSRMAEESAEKLKADGDFRGMRKALDQAEYALNEAIAQENHAKGRN